MSAFEMNFDMSCTDQISRLRTLMKENTGHQMEAGDILCPRIPSAPFEESMFDSLSIYARWEADGRVSVILSITDWSYGKGYTSTEKTIRIFDSADACQKWLGATDAAAEYCLKAFRQHT